MSSKPQLHLVILVRMEKITVVNLPVWGFCEELLKAIEPFPFKNTFTYRISHVFQ